MSTVAMFQLNGFRWRSILAHAPRSTRSVLVSLAGLTWLFQQSIGFAENQWVVPKPVESGMPLSGTERLDWDGDIAARMVDQADAFLLRRLADSIQRREKHWERNFTTPEAYVGSIAEKRKRLSHLLGLRDARSQPVELQLAISTSEIVGSRTQLVGGVASGPGFDLHAVTWHVVDDVKVHGLLLEPRGVAVANVIAIPDCEVTPDRLVGVSPGIAPSSQYARRLARLGCRVVVPLLINRHRGEFDWGARAAPSITNREMIYRSAYELGRGIVAYEVQSVLAVVDWFSSAASSKDNPIGVIGWGEGGLLALYCGALDTRIKSTTVSGYFTSRQDLWQEPIDRNVFGLLREFGDAELATMITPRSIVVEASVGPESRLSGEGGGAPARLESPKLDAVEAEVERARRLAPAYAERIQLIVTSGDSPKSGGESPGQGPCGSDDVLGEFIKQLTGKRLLPDDLAATIPVQLNLARQLPDYSTRHREQMRSWDRHTQAVLRNSPNVRREYWSRLDTSSLDAFRKTVEPYRESFYQHVVGKYDLPLDPPNPRTRMAYRTDDWTAYEVVLDVFDDVFAYGLLLLPNQLQRQLEDGGNVKAHPVVVCQHGLEGRPQDTIGPQSAHYYSAFAGELAKRGYVCFSPQNLYIGRDRFRTLQRKSYPLNKTLFSIIVPQHQQLVNWLKTLAYVDAERIAFYGLSYGGKTAMRVPPLVPEYCLSICSADFNEWVDKNASTTNPRSYVWTGEYEIFEFDLGSTFNYAEMATLIAPRPFMVERGHFDGVADDWTVGWEFAKVRNLYAARLKLPPDFCQIEWFDGPHKINGQATYRFLDRHLRDRP